MANGRLSKSELEHLAAQHDIQTVVVGFTDLYGRLVGKRFSAKHFLKQVIEHGTHACDYLLTVDMEMEPVAGYAYANWTKGYGDFHLQPDYATLREATWLEQSAIVLCDVCDHQHDLVPVAPRSLLKHQIQAAHDLGFAAMAGSEAEYFLFGDNYRSAGKSNFHNLSPAGDYIEDYHILQGTREEPFNARLRRCLDESGIPVECTKGEWGLGQHELNLEFAEVLEMADRHVLYKQCAKEIADSLGMSVTFMAKPHEDQAGSSCHVHVSLWRDDQNIFHGDKDFCGIHCSDEFRWFLGGWMKHAAELMVLMAPNVNSYKRYQPGSWAPTRLAWARDNRTAGFRVVGAGKSLRIECRIPGADCNPYLTYAAALAAGMDGIRNQTEPSAMFAGNAYDTVDVPHVPKTLHEATQLFADSHFARDTFGSSVVDHYAHFFHTEQAAFDKAVTDWERRRYFERI